MEPKPLWSRTGLRLTTASDRPLQLENPQQTTACQLAVPWKIAASVSDRAADMNTLLIAYDFHKLGQRYLLLRSLIRRNFPGAWHALESTYIVSTPMTPTQLRDLLKPALGENDELLVVGLEKSHWAWRGNTRKGADWMHENASSSSNTMAALTMVDLPS